jgi:hypothetical protein
MSPRSVAWPGPRSSLPRLARGPSPSLSSMHTQAALVRGPPAGPHWSRGNARPLCFVVPPRGQGDRPAGRHPAENRLRRPAVQQIEGLDTDAEWRQRLWLRTAPYEIAAEGRHLQRVARGEGGQPEGRACELGGRGGQPVEQRRLTANRDRCIRARHDHADRGTLGHDACLERAAPDPKPQAVGRCREQQRRDVRPARGLYSEVSERRDPEHARDLRLPEALHGVSLPADLELIPVLTSRAKRSSSTPVTPWGSKTRTS